MAKKKKKIKRCKNGEHKCDHAYEICPQCGFAEGDCEKCGTYCDSEGVEIK